MAGEVTLKWSDTFRLAPSPEYSNKDLKGDKIILPQSALEQLLAASTSSSSTATTNGSAFNPYVSARPQHAYYADSHQQLPHPLMFRLINQENGNFVYAGIREFSAEEGEVLLSPYLLDALGIQDRSYKKHTRGSGSTSADAIHISEDEDEGQGEGEKPPQIIIHAKQLAKGTYVRLRPLEAGYNPDDWKSLLERQLRESFTTLTNGALLSVRGVKGETFRFLIDRFRPEGDGICVVDTDLEVDIEALNEEQARETMRQIMSKARRAPGSAEGSSVGQELNIWKAVEGQVLPDDYVDYELRSWPRSRSVGIELSGLGDDYAVDLFVSPKSSRQRASPRESEHVFGGFTSDVDGCKKITIQPTNVEIENAESLLISVHGYLPDDEPSGDDASPIPFQLRVRAGTDDSSTSAKQAGAPMEVDGEERAPDDEQCQNCRQWVPKRAMVLHENFCRRNNIACPHCGNVFQKNSEEWKDHWHCPHDDAYGSSEKSKAKHERIYHTNHQCPSCPFTTNSLADLARHRTTLCPAKIILCQFCHLEVPQEGDPFNPSAESRISGLTAHELVDGARTTDCHLCSKIIKLREMSTHLKHHELEKANRPKPAICRNVNCGRTLHGVGKNGAVGAGTQMGQGPGNDLGLCSLCFTPLYVSLHDPEGNALRRRIERRYLMQMTQGCNKKWCENPWCKTGRTNTGLEVMGGASNSQTVIPFIKPLVNGFRDKQNVPMFLCVDESNKSRRKLAETMADDTDWDLEWCVAACEAEGPNIDKAKVWLANWAPTKV